MSNDSLAQTALDLYYNSTRSIPGDTSWVMICSALVLIQTPGLAQFYGGMVRAKSMISTMMLSAIVMGALTIQWWAFGYSFTFGGGNVFYGSGQFVGLRNVGFGPNPDYAPNIPHIVFVLYQMMFCILAQAIVSGAVVERMSFRSWFVFVLFWSLLVYSPVAHWNWSAWTTVNQYGNLTLNYGWMRSFGIMDWAGGLAIHLSPGVSSFVACLMVGKRDISAKRRRTIKLVNIGHVVMGGATLWFGWFGFNGGVPYAANVYAGIAIINTQTSTAAAFMTFVFLDWLIKGKPTVVGAFSGAIIGLVGITPGAGFVSFQVAPAIGCITTLVCYGVLFLKQKYVTEFFPGFDDTLDVTTGHGVAGAMGMFLLGFFADKGVNPEVTRNGVFYGGGGLQLGWQVVGIVVTAAWAAALTFIILLPITFILGLRVNAEEESLGTDSEFLDIIHTDVEDSVSKSEELKPKRKKKKKKKKKGSGSDVEDDSDNEANFEMRNIQARTAADEANQTESVDEETRSDRGKRAKI